MPRQVTGLPRRSASNPSSEVDRPDLVGMLDQRRRACPAHDPVGVASAPRPRPPYPCAARPRHRDAACRSPPPPGSPPGPARGAQGSYAPARRRAGSRRRPRPGRARGSRAPFGRSGRASASRLYFVSPARTSRAISRSARASPPGGGPASDQPFEIAFARRIVVDPAAVGDERQRRHQLRPEPARAQEPVLDPAEWQAAREVAQRFRLLPAQTRSPRPSAFARAAARPGSSSKTSGFSRPKAFCRCAAFPEPHAGRDMARAVVAEGAHLGLQLIEPPPRTLQSRSRQGSYHVGARIIAAANSWARVSLRSRRATGFSSAVRPQPA